MADDLGVRLATSKDVDLILAGFALIGDHLGTSDKITATAEDLRRHGFGPSPAFLALIAEVDGAFAGLCVFFPSFSTWRGKPGAYIQDFAVVERFRGKGVAEALLRQTARHVRTKGGTYLRLSVDADNVTAQRFYERMGVSHKAGELIHAAYEDAFERLAGIEESGV